MGRLRWRRQKCPLGGECAHSLVPMVAQSQNQGGRAGMFLAPAPAPSLCVLLSIIPHCLNSGSCINYILALRNLRLTCPGAQSWGEKLQGNLDFSFSTSAAWRKGRCADTDNVLVTRIFLQKEHRVGPVSQSVSHGTLSPGRCSVVTVWGNTNLWHLLFSPKYEVHISLLKVLIGPAVKKMVCLTFLSISIPLVYLTSGFLYTYDIC